MKSRYTAAILTLLLLASPIFAADAASAQQMPVVEMKPGTMTVMERFAPIYYADGGETRGSVYYAASSTAPDNIIYTRPSGRLYSFTFHPGVPEKLYYANANQNDIYMVAETGSGWSAESTIFTHKTYVRDIAFAFDQNSDLGLYFSEATGAGGDGTIYRIDGAAATPIYTVKLADVGGFWAGDFAFDYDGNLYLSSGNQVPASIYKVATGTGAITRIFESRDTSIAGLVFRDGRLYYADWRQNIYRLDLGSGTSTLYYTNPARIWLSDVGFKERRDAAGSRPMVGTYGLTAAKTIFTSARGLPQEDGTDPTKPPKKELSPF